MFVEGGPLLTESSEQLLHLLGYELPEMVD